MTERVIEIRKRSEVAFVAAERAFPRYGDVVMRNSSERTRMIARRSALLAALVVGVLAVPAAASAVPAGDRSCGRITWIHKKERFTVESGAVNNVDIPFKAVAPPKPVSGKIEVRITSKLNSVLRVDIAAVRPRPDGTYVLPATVTGTAVSRS
ncbi:hypothetical protein [Actinoplanes subtropicus]|uniref:hypothetical protein n=1 Tax=Actinoplanes subtropicus TaxID=543632 RepID=UPI0004C334D0|nr:hypothetical protein [Actinoplanes subtropicus]